MFSFSYLIENTLKSFSLHLIKRQILTQAQEEPGVPIPPVPMGFAPGVFGPDGEAGGWKTHQHRAPSHTEPSTVTLGEY